MKKFTLLSTVLLLILSLVSCKQKEEKVIPAEIDYKTKEITDLSIYNLPSQWTNQKGNEVYLKDFRGDVLVVVMIYTSCKAACPRLVADMRNIEERVQTGNKDQVKYILVSIDPETDTPERLAAFAKENQMDGDQWVFLRSTQANTREFAATLAVNYKKIDPIDFSHSNIISVFNKEGELAYQQEGLGLDYTTTVNEIEKQLEL